MFPVRPACRSSASFRTLAPAPNARRTRCSMYKPGCSGVSGSSAPGLDGLRMPWRERTFALRATGAESGQQTAQMRDADSAFNDSPYRRIRLMGMRLLFIAVLLSGCLWAQDTAPPETRAAELVSRMTLAEKVSQMQDTAPAIPRLGIPAYGWWNEALHGVARAGLATVFPQAIGLAATWDTDLEHRIAEIISTEARAKYNDAIAHG